MLSSFKPDSGRTDVYVSIFRLRSGHSLYWICRCGPTAWRCVFNGSVHSSISVLDFLIFPVSRGNEMQTSCLFNVRLCPEQISHSFSTKKKSIERHAQFWTESLFSSTMCMQVPLERLRNLLSKDGNEVDCEEIRRSPRSQFYSGQYGPCARLGGATKGRAS